MIFKDSEGREWNAAIKISTVNRMMEHGQNFYSLEDDNAKALREAHADRFKMTQLALHWLWFICKPQADERGVTKADFQDSFIGESLKSAMEAFRESYANFTPSPAIRSWINEHLKIDREADNMMHKANQQVADFARQQLESLGQQISEESISKMLNAELEKKQNSMSLTKPQD